MAHKANLKIEGKEYKVLEFEYEFSQPVNEIGQPSARPGGGFIYLTIASPDNNDMRFHEWMFSKTEVKNGELHVEVVDDGRASKKTITFKDAHCIRFYEYFNSNDNEQMYMKITISAAEIGFGSGIVFRNDGKA